MNGNKVACSVVLALAVIAAACQSGATDRPATTTVTALPTIVVMSNAPAASPQATATGAWATEPVTSTPTKTPLPPYPDTTEPTFGPALVREGDFQLSLTTGASEYVAGQPVAAEAEFLYSGASDSIRLTSLTPGPLGWGVAHGDGTSYVEPDWSLWCGNNFEMARGEPIRQRFTKFGAPAGLNGKEGRKWLMDPDLRLPAGRWVIYVVAMFGTADCGGSYMRASAEIVVR